jgi:hypothetical protein
VARIEAKAAQGDIAGALADIASLPEQARGPFQAWAQKAEARKAALESARRLTAGALAAVAQPAKQDRQ